MAADSFDMEWRRLGSNHPSKVRSTRSPNVVIEVLVECEPLHVVRFDSSVHPGWVPDSSGPPTEGDVLAELLPLVLAFHVPGMGVRISIRRRLERFVHLYEHVSMHDHEGGACGCHFEQRVLRVFT